MSSEESPGPAGGRRQRRLVTAVKDAMRDLNVQLSLFNRQVGAHVQLRDVDFDCLEVLNRRGPLSPTALARHAGLHPATLTGVIDRLERGRWVVRERDPNASDRRAVTIRALRERNPEMFRLLAGMNHAMDGILADYTEPELQLIADFLRRTSNAGAKATEELGQ
jgi:DNA-binding MarR family transcriptional regulator